MSSKINIRRILSAHVSTLRDASTGKLSFVDIFTFFIVPLLCAVLFLYLEVNLSESVASLLVNFGAIFTALLLSVLVLVYDQSSKVKDAKKTLLSGTKKELIKQLFNNICYSIILSLALITASLGHSMVLGKVSEFSGLPFVVFWGGYVFTPLIVFLTAHLMLTVIMIVKRMGSLLDSE